MVDGTFKKHNNTFGSPIHSMVALIALIALVILLVNAVFNMYGRYREADIRADRARAEIISLEGRKRELSEDLVRLSSPRGREEELRRQFNVAAEGEEIIVIIDPYGSDSDSEYGKGLDIWQKLRDLFKW